MTDTGSDAEAVAGLSAAEVAARRAEYGANVAPRAPRRSAGGRVLDQLRDPMILLLLGAGAVVAAVGDPTDAAIILAVVCLNTAIGVVQEIRAANALDALDRLAAPHATVVREGRQSRIAATDLVPGDVVRLDAGDVVPADLRLELAAGLEVDESTMTGESVPVGRRAGAELFAGTVVTRGRAHGTVLRTGAGSALGAIAASVAAAGSRATPLQVRLSRLSGQLVVLTLALAGLVFLLGVLRGEPVADTLVLGVSLAVAAIPESLPAVVTVALALGAYRMARRHALVRRLPAVETLGSVTVLAVDKTGTLTEGHMTVREVWTPSGVRRVGGVGYAVAGEFSPAGDEELAVLVRDLVLCNDARLEGAPDRTTWDVVGDPMEAALLVAAAKHDRAALELPSAWRRLDEVPFDSLTKRMATLHEGPAGRLVVVKGAPEAVLPAVADGAAADAALSEAGRLAARGFRVLAVADAAPSEKAPDLAEPAGLRLRGLVALVDPPRPAARDVVAACREAGIRTVMITGDHPATARAIADELTITSGTSGTSGTPQVAVGADVARGPDADVRDIGVYARTRPDDKVDIVGAWQRLGAVVAMTGDGVNDAPALRNADIGVAMGGRGTEVARQAADLVLGDDDLGTLVAAVEEGRRIYTNVRRFLRFGLAGGLAEVLVLLAGPWLGMPLPLTPAQILWINMVTHGVPGVAFGGEPADPADMARPSPSPERSVLGGLVREICLTAAMIAAVALAAGLSADGQGARQTSVFLCLGLAQLWLALALRAPRTGAGWRSRGLEAAVGVSAVLLVGATTWPPLRDLLDASAVTLRQAALVALLAAGPAVVVAARARLARARGSRARAADSPGGAMPFGPAGRPGHGGR
ncbi:cation-transporting P-type ATPase [Nocardioides hungaricus]